MLLAAAQTASKYDFDPSRENGGMIAMGVIVLVTWLAFRQMLKLANKKVANEKVANKKRD